VAAALQSADEPVCHLYAGLFAAAVSFLDRSERHAAELACAAAGAATCVFVVGSGADIDAAEAWRQQKTPVQEIIRRLR
jgi:predicted hydrocarbon binding protein